MGDEFLTEDDIERAKFQQQERNLKDNLEDALSSSGFPQVVFKIVIEKLFETRFVLDCTVRSLMLAHDKIEKLETAVEKLRTKI